MQGLILRALPSPRQTTLSILPVAISVDAGTTRVINFPIEFKGLGQSIQILNRDGTNAITIIINDDRRNAFTIPAGAGIAFNDQWLEQIEVVAGAAGVTVVMASITPLGELGLHGV